ncbi:transposase [Streptomyces misionensis]|uniref:transposase n=1 Tax=Streptomyces misionensis TaxID=67331 RepID=UPI0033F90AD0
MQELGLRAPYLRRADTRPDTSARSGGPSGCAPLWPQSAWLSRAGPGARIARIPDALPEPEIPAPRAVGVDECGTRKGRHYSSALVDIETRRPVDLLPDRETSSLAALLADRPGIEFVCRDRAPFFAEGASVGVPQAVQVADRWHLWHNLSEAAERAVAQHRRCLRALVPAAPETRA